MTRGFVYDFDSWGKPYWQVMHSVTFLYPETPTDEDKQRVQVFFRLVPNILPCALCGLHFVRTLEQYPLSDEVLSSRETLARWLVDVHNTVNERLKHEVVSYEKVKHFYTKDSSVPLRTSEIVVPKNDYKMPFFGVLCAAGLIAIGLIVFFLLKKNQNVRIKAKP
jgi:hypothetical protein